MGCHQSKVEEQVVAPASNDLVVHSAVEASVTVEVPSTVPEETASQTAAETAGPVADEENTTTITITEEVPQEESAPAPEPAADDAPTVVEEAPVEAEATPAPVSESNAESTEASPSETVQEVTEESTEEPVEETEKTEETQVEQQPQQEPVAEAEEPEAESTVSFKPLGVSFGERNVVFYEFSLVDKADPAKELTIRKRFNDFKALHEQVAKLMASEANVPTSQKGKFATYPALPALPKAGAGSVIFGRRNPNVTGDRKAQFEKILNAIARHPIAYASPAFQSFLVSA